AGTSVPKVDGRAIVTGTHRYSSDVKPPGMLFDKVLRPPALKATLDSAKIDDAKAMAGVTVVYEGSFVAVAAPTLHTAEQALVAVHAVWKKPSDELSSDNLFAYLKDHARAGGGGGGFGGFGRQSRGSIATGLKDADQKVEATYTIAY